MYAWEGVALEARASLIADGHDISKATLSLSMVNYWGLIRDPTIVWHHPPNPVPPAGVPVGYWWQMTVMVDEVADWVIRTPPKIIPIEYEGIL